MHNKGKIVASYTYDAWGVCKIVSDSTGIIARINPFRYRSYYYDQEIGLYYLQSRYYDAGVGRFLNSDNVDYLGLAGTAASYNLFTYCENDCVDFVDYFGHAPSVSTLTRMHNAVVQSAQSFLLSVGTITTSEVRTCNSKGKYVGRMDIYSQISNKVWEVKRNNYAGITAGKRQLNEYTSSYIYSLYHSWFRIRKKPRMGTKNVYGCTIVSGYLVTYQSYANNPALILYDYMTLEKAAELLFIAAMATSSAFVNALARSAKKTQEKVNTVLAQIRGILAKVNSTTRKFTDAIKEFLKNALPIILAIIAIVIIIFILCSSVVVIA